jgi:hypothetical protein
MQHIVAAALNIFISFFPFVRILKPLFAGFGVRRISAGLAHAL